MTSRLRTISLIILSLVLLAGVGVAWAINFESSEGSAEHARDYVGDAAESEGIPAEIGVVAESLDRASALDEAAAIEAARRHAPSNIMKGSLTDASSVTARLVSYTSTQEPNGVSDAGKPLEDMPCWMVVFRGLMMHNHGGGYVVDADPDAKPEAYSMDLVVFLDADTGDYVRMTAYPSAASTR